MNYARANAQGNDLWTRININLYPCLYVLKNLAKAAVPELLTAGTPNMPAGQDAVIVR
jgi:hypothetical protein